MDDGQKVITIAHPEQSSGELKRLTLFHPTYFITHAPALSVDPALFAIQPDIRRISGSSYFNPCHAE